MTDVAQAAAIVLAAVFAWAAVTKLRTQAETAASFRGLLLPVPTALARGLPLIELGVAAGLVVAPSPASWMALALLAAFSIVIVRAIVAGSTVPCACFGGGASRGDARPLSTIELVRNAGLGGLAVVASGAGSGRVGWPARPALVIVTVVVALGRVVFAVADRRRRGRVRSASVGGG
ncbi:MAG TPA: MauE/DoxX family redox-associated membrane protein [Acidimicrobiales bacterium]|nr:MauE/DoxX family redox-associated membrane protein [Acidimicrobiales bacterium]